jgi:hypothetical protein
MPWDFAHARIARASTFELVLVVSVLVLAVPATSFATSTAAGCGDHDGTTTSGYCSIIVLSTLFSLVSWQVQAHRLSEFVNHTMH